MTIASSPPASSRRWPRPDRIAILAAALLLGAAWIPAATAAELHVSPAGSDDNPGTATAPFRTIARAAQAATPGTTVLVAPGTYEGGFATRASGTETLPIRYVSTRKWGARIVPPADSTSKFAWNNRGANVRIDGFEVDGGEYRGGVRWRIGLYTAGSNSAIENAKVQNIAREGVDMADSSGGAGIYGDGYHGATNITLARNLVLDIGPAHSTSNLVHGIYMTTTGTVTDNSVHRIVGTAVHLWHDARRVLIARNHLSGSKFGILVGGGDYVLTRGPNDHTQVQDNTVENNRVCGIAEQGDTGPNNRYVANRVFGNGRDWCLQTGVVTARGSPIRP